MKSFNLLMFSAILMVGACSTNEDVLEVFDKRMEGVTEITQDLDGKKAFATYNEETRVVEVIALFENSKTLKLGTYKFDFVHVGNRAAFKKGDDTLTLNVSLGKEPKKADGTRIEDATMPATSDTVDVGAVTRKVYFQ